MAESDSRGLRAWWRRRWSDERYIESLRKWQKHAWKARIACAAGFVLMIVLLVSMATQPGFLNMRAQSEAETRAFDLGFWTGAIFGFMVYATFFALFMATVGPFGQRAGDLTLKLYDKLQAKNAGDADAPQV